MRSLAPLGARPWLGGLALISLCSASVGAQNQSFEAIEDATARESDADGNFGDGDLQVEFHHSASSSKVKRAYLRFDVTGIDGVSVDCLTLKLKEGSGGSSTETNFEVRLVNGAWDEDSLTWNNRPAPGRTVGAYLGPEPSEGEVLHVALDPSFLQGDGIYDLVLVEDKNGGFDDANFTSREGSSPPELIIGCSGIQAQTAFWVRQTESAAPYAVDFLDLSTGNNTDWSWDFGDGTTSTLRNPRHTYTTEDRYTVTLTASGPAGSQTRTRTDYVLAYPADQGPGSVVSWSKISSTTGGNTPNLEDADMFARGIANIGDLDGDGVIDLIVGAVGDDDGADKAGAAYVLFLRSDGTVRDYSKISALWGGLGVSLDASDGFGRVVAGIGDLDLDGVPDIAIGANRDDDGGSNRGAVYILFMHPDGTVKGHQKISDTTGNFTADLDNSDEFGRGIACLGDLDGDGVVDLAVGATGDDDGSSSNGAVYVLFMRNDGTVKSFQKLSDTQGGMSSPFFPGLWFGMSVASLGDVDGDGLQDLAVGGNQDDAGGESSGAAYVILMNSDGTAKSDTRITAAEGGLVWGELEVDDEFGAAIGGPGDVDGDGIPDLTVGSIRDNDNHAGKTEIFVDRGAVYVFFLEADGSVRDYQKISDTRGNFDAQLSDYVRFGEALGDIGDFNGDGTPDIIVGSRFDNDGGANRGALYMLYLNGSGAVYTAPSADFTGGPTNGPAPLSVAFTDKSGGEPTAWTWDFGDGSSSNDRNPVHEYAQPGTYSVSLTVSDGIQSDTRSFPDIVRVESTTAPVAGFQANATAGTAPLDITFTDLSNGSIDAWAWDFGDGTTSNERSPLHVYTAVGVYTVSLEVSGPLGSDTLVETDLVTVLPATNEDPAILRYGCGVNPAGSLAVVSGRPVLGTTMLFGIHNPLGTQEAGAVPLLFFALNADAAYPCGTLAPGFGMSGGDGAFLVSLIAPDPVLRVQGGSWDGLEAAQVSFTFPVLPVLAGLDIHAQGLLVDPSPGTSVPYALTDGLVLTMELTGTDPGPSNLARDGSATQSSDLDGQGLAAMAIDGNTDGDYATGSVTHTAKEPNAWWEVDLGSVRQLDHVDLWNRTDCCAERLNASFVLVSDDPFPSTDPLDLLSTPGVYVERIDTAADPMTHVPLGRGGRYVRVQLEGTDYLHLAEVEVQGHGATTAPTCPNGLLGQYFEAQAFGTLRLTRVDPTVDFAWSTGEPVPELASDDFAIRWTGYVQPLFDETYTFTTTTDDGVRLWIDGQLVIDHWIDQADTDWSGSIALTAGEYHALVLEYYENGGHATARLSWDSPSQPFEVIPTERLFSCDPR